MTLKPMERTANERPMNDAQRRWQHGPILPMQDPSWLDRLLAKVRGQ
jgi:hypothetical protein